MRLSICIPTHEGRAEALGGALDSILGQLGPALDGVVEVCVSDNGSSDATREIMRRHCEARPTTIVYDRFEENRGFTANLLRVIEMARGEFCWIFGSDDAVVPGGVRQVLDLLERHPEVTGATLYPVPYDFSAQREVRAVWPPPLPARHELRHHWTTLEDAAVQCGLLMGILPAQVVRRELWIEVAEELRGPALDRHPRFPHLAVIYRMLRQRPSWSWEPERVFSMRADTVNSVVEELDGNVTQYHLETTAETVAIWREVFGPGPIVRGLLRRLLQALFNPVAVAGYRLHPAQGPDDDRRLLRAAVAWFRHLPEFWLLTFPVLLVPGRILRGLQSLAARRHR